MYDGEGLSEQLAQVKARGSKGSSQPMEGSWFMTSGVAGVEALGWETDQCVLGNRMLLSAAATMRQKALEDFCHPELVGEVLAMLMSPSLRVTRL